MLASCVVSKKTKSKQFHLIFQKHFNKLKTKKFNHKILNTFNYSLFFIQQQFVETFINHFTILILHCHTQTLESYPFI